MFEMTWLSMESSEQYEVKVHSSGASLHVNNKIAEFEIKRCSAYSNKHVLRYEPYKLWSGSIYDKL